MKSITAVFLVLLVGVNSSEFWNIWVWSSAFIIDKKKFHFLGPDENRFSFDQSFNAGLDKVADFLNPDDKDADVLLNGWIDQLQDSFTELANNEHVIEFSNNIKSKFQDDGEFKEIIGDFGDQFQEGMYVVYFLVKKIF